MENKIWYDNVTGRPNMGSDRYSNMQGSWEDYLVNPMVSTGYTNDLGATKKEEIMAIKILDNNNKIGMGVGNIHIQTLENGFLVTYILPDGSAEITCFNEFKDLLAYIDSLDIMDNNTTKVIENI